MPPTVLRSDVRFDGRIFRVTVDRVVLPHGARADLEIVRHPPSVVILPMTDTGELMLVRQYRYPVDAWMWELPAGSVDEGESIEAAARRECDEEIGLRPRELRLLSALYPTPGYCDELMHFFLATGLHAPASPAARDADEHLEPRAFALTEVRAMIQRGEILDMKTVLGASLL